MELHTVTLPDDRVFELTREALDELPYGVITLDRRGTVLRYNQAEASFAHRASESTIGFNFFADIAPCTNVQAFKGRFDAFATGTESGVDRFDFSFAFRWGRHDVSITLLRKHDHEEINVLVRGRSLATIDPSALTVHTPLSADRRARLQPAAAAAAAVVARVLAVPERWTRDSERDAHWRARIHPDDAAGARNAIADACAQQRPYAIEYRVLDEGRRARVYQEHGDFANAASGVTVIEVTDQRTREESLWRIANYDELTGLASRALLLRRIEEATVEAAAAGTVAGVLFLDLDRFKVVNDTFGHAVGDELLREVALRLGECVRGGDTIARLNGDEFVLLITDIDEPAAAERTARRVLSTLSRPFSIGGRLHYVTASIGISMAPYHGADATVLLHAADRAMYASKEAQRNGFAWFTAEMSASVATNVQLEEELRVALQRGELTVYYQPLVDLNAGAIFAAEALVRWNHPRRGLVMPGEFIPVAERCGLILALGEHVLRTACVQARTWAKAGHEIRVCVNVSTAQFRQKNFADTIRAILEETGARPEQLELELTESMMLDGFSETMDTLTELKLMGLRLAVDDFGTGYSSLAYLKYFPVDTLKLDRTFVADIAADTFDRAIATAVLAIAHDLKLECVAEGIEDADQMVLLRTLGCRRMQGYYFARPQPAHAFSFELGNTLAKV